LNRVPRVHSHYDNLKVTRDAPPEVIRAAYRALTAKYHPDRNADNDDTARVMRLLNAAYEVLSDPTRRDEHDRWISDQETDAPVPPAPATRGMQRVKSDGGGGLLRHLARAWHWYGLCVLLTLFALALAYWLREQRNAPVLDSKMLDPTAVDSSERAPGTR
jgi:curved DNA-binding protein CbpA